MGYLSDKFIHYLHQSQSPVEGTIIVPQTMEETCKKYVKKHGIVPVLFVDGAYLI